MLTELQRRIAALVLSASWDRDLALGGGAALISKRLVERTTSDLDFFTTEPHVDELVGAIAGMLERDGVAVDVEEIGPTFARLVATTGEHAFLIDVAQDARMLPVETTELGPTISSEELAADKTLALWTRAEARDFVDVFFLARRFGRHRMCELALQKDPVFDHDSFAEMLGTIRRLDREEFEVDDATISALQRFFDDWRTALRSGGEGA